MISLVEFLWEDIRCVCEGEILKAQERLGGTMTNEVRAHLRTVPDEIAIRLVARCLDAVDQARTEEERARIIETLIRVFGWGRPVSAASARTQT